VIPKSRQEVTYSSIAPSITATLETKGAKLRQNKGRTEKEIHRKIQQL